MTKGWFQVEAPSSTYFTHSPNGKNRHHLVGPGDRDPSPKEILDAILEYPEGDLVCGGKIIKEYDKKRADSESITLPAGCYSHATSSYTGETPERLIPMSLRDDHFLKMSDIYDPLVGDVKSFFANEAIYREIGIMYKRGILLYGPPGEGKSTLLRSIVKNELPEESVVIFFDEMPSNAFILKMKETLSSRMKVVIFEELLALLENSKIERVLDFLDGERSMDRTLIIGTTNYPERLPGNIVNRPSRFDRLYKMGNPKEKERQILLTHYLKRSPTEIELRATKELSTAAIKEACLLTHLKGITLEEATKLMKSHADLVKKEFSESRKLGLGMSQSNDED